MKTFGKFLEEAAEAKKCPAGKYWCFDDKKCKSIPSGYHIGRRGYVEQDKEDEGKKNGNGNGNGNSNGHSTNGNGGSGSADGGGGGE